MKATLTVLLLTKSHVFVLYKSKPMVILEHGSENLEEFSSVIPLNRSLLFDFKLNPRIIGEQKERSG